MGSDYITELASVEDKLEIYELISDSFFNDMPLFHALSVNTPPCINTWPALQTLADNLTIKAVSNGKIIGVAINVIPKDGDAVPVPSKLSKFFDYLEDDSKGLLGKLETSELELRVMVVHRDWRGMKVSKRLVEESERLAKKIGRTGIFGMATGAFMERAFKGHNWNCMYRLQYQDYLSIDPNFIPPAAPHTSLTLYYKKFDDELISM